MLSEQDLDAASATLTDTQKKIMVIIRASTTPRIAFENTNNDPNMIAARDALKQMNLIDVVGSEVALNDTGIQTMRDEGLTDESGELIQGVKEKYLKDIDIDSDTGGSTGMMAGGPIGGEPIDGTTPPAPGQPPQDVPPGGAPQSGSPIPGISDLNQVPPEKEQPDKKSTSIPRESFSLIRELIGEAGFSQR